MRGRRFFRCIRPCCLRERLSGWPLCFVDFDELPQATREAWRRTFLLRGADKRRAQEQWQIRLLDLDGKQVPLCDIRIPAWEPPAKARGKAS